MDFMLKANVYAVHRSITFFLKDPYLLNIDAPLHQQQQIKDFFAMKVQIFR